jgi:hypothetical protein
MLYSLFQSAFFWWVALQPKRSSHLFTFAFYRYLVDGLPSVWNGTVKSYIGLPSVWNGIVKSCIGLPSVWNGIVKSCNGLPSVWSGTSKIVVGLPIVWNSTSKIVVGVSQQFSLKNMSKQHFSSKFFSV